MTIRDRDALVPGMRLEAAYKGVRRTCTVVESDSGEALAFLLDDGVTYTSLSSAGREVMDGATCNGWRFWHIEGEPVRSQTPPRHLRPRCFVPENFRVVANQTGAPADQRRIFCRACLSGFYAAATDDLDRITCPRGHHNLAPEPVKK